MQRLSQLYTQQSRSNSPCGSEMHRHSVGKVTGVLQTNKGPASVFTVIVLRVTPNDGNSMKFLRIMTSSAKIRFHLGKEKSYSQSILSLTRAPEVKSASSRKEDLSEPQECPNGKKIKRRKKEDYTVARLSHHQFKILVENECNSDGK